MLNSISPCTARFSFLTIFERHISTRRHGIPILPFDEARNLAHGLGIKASTEWLHRRYDRPYGLPASPEQYYRNKGFIDFPDFFGYERTRKSRTPRKNVNARSEKLDYKYDVEL